jgi:hypothetical protein
MAHHSQSAYGMLLGLSRHRRPRARGELFTVPSRSRRRFASAGMSALRRLRLNAFRPVASGPCLTSRSAFLKTARDVNAASCDPHERPSLGKAVVRIAVATSRVDEPWRSHAYSMASGPRLSLVANGRPPRLRARRGCEVLPMGSWHACFSSRLAAIAHRTKSGACQIYVAGPSHS